MINKFRIFIASLTFANNSKRVDFLDHYYACELKKIDIYVFREFKYEKYGCKIIVVKNNTHLASTIPQLHPITISEAIFLLNEKHNLRIEVGISKQFFFYKIIHKDRDVQSKIDSHFNNIDAAAKKAIFDSIQMITKGYYTYYSKTFVNGVFCSKKYKVYL